jgi:glycerophosphoryl diester phosphodiesterase
MLNDNATPRAWPLAIFLMIGIFVSAAQAAGTAAQQAELVAIARLPADTLIPGDTSGQFLNPEDKATNFIGPPYPDAQPVQGISAIVDEGKGRYLALLDNGYGSKANSPDFVLSIYRIRPEFKTVEGGAGVLHIESRIALRDPDRNLPYPRVIDSAMYPDSAMSVPPGMQQRAWLTGADLDPESLQRMEGGHYWVGDEFGPFLLHFGRSGKLLEPPIGLPGYHSEDNPLIAEPATVSRSGGFEGMALDREKGVLYPMLEKALAGSPGVLEIFALDIASKQFLPAGQPAAVMRYRLDEGAHAVGAFQYLGAGMFLTIERDREQGAAARIKRIYRVKQGEVDEQGLLRKQLMVDLLQIGDTTNLSSLAKDGVFAFAYETIESLVVMASDRLGVVNDNNFPFGNGPDGKDAEETVFAVIHVPLLAEPFQAD